MKKALITVAIALQLCSAQSPRKPAPLEPGEIALLVEKRRLIEKAEAELNAAFKRYQDAQLNYTVAENEMKTKREAADCRITAAFTIDCTPAPAPPKPATAKPKDSGKGKGK